MTLLKIANEVNEEVEDNTPVKRLLGALKVQGGINVANAGAKIANSNLDKVTGSERMYHVTDQRNVKGIQEEGLLGNLANSTSNSQRAAIHTIPGSENKVYLGKKKSVAKEVSRARSKTSDNMFGNDVILKSVIPYEDLNSGKVKTVGNPEMRGLSRREFVKLRSLQSSLPLSEQVPTFINDTGMNDRDFVLNRMKEVEARGVKPSKNLLQRLSEHLNYSSFNNNTATIDGNLDSKYIVGGKGYQRRGLQDVARYVKGNKVRFAKGVGGVLGGGAVAGGGAELGIDGVKDIVETYKNRGEDYD